MTEIKSVLRLSPATIRPNGWLLIVTPTGSAERLFLPRFSPGPEIIMTKLRLVLLATTALTALQFVHSSSHAQTAPLVVAQAAPKEELGPDGKPKHPPKAQPPAAPPKAAPPPPPPAAAPPRPPTPPP